MLFHSKFGLCIHIVTNHYNEMFLVLRPDDVDFELFFERFRADGSSKSDNEFVIDTKFVQDILENMESEWDKKIVRVLLSANRSRAELAKLGIESDYIVSQRNSVLEIVKCGFWHKLPLLPLLWHTNAVDEN